MHYHLYPPFFVVPEEHSFEDSWESFCCKMANLCEMRNDIYRRTPPEDGIDLYCKSTGVAYQCKSIESGRSGAFNVSNAVKSIKSAKAVQGSLPWKKYVLCTNVDVTGSTEEKIRAEHSKIEIRSRGYWTQACEKYPDAAEVHFRRLISIPRRRTEEALHDGFVEHYSEQLLDLLKKSSVGVFLYSNRHDRIYRVLVSLDFKVDDLLYIFRKFFRLPGPRNFVDAGISVSLSHSLIVDGKKQTFGMSLQECGVAEGAVITFWTTIIWEELHEKATVGHMNLVIGESDNARKEAISEYKALVSNAFERFDMSIRADESGA